MRVTGGIFSSVHTLNFIHGSLIDARPLFSQNYSCIYLLNVPASKIEEIQKQIWPSLAAGADILQVPPDRRKEKGEEAIEWCFQLPYASHSRLTEMSIGIRNDMS